MLQRWRDERVEGVLADGRDERVCWRVGGMRGCVGRCGTKYVTKCGGWCVRGLSERLKERMSEVCE